ncbi:hypothetical protein Hanom_Chr08g00735201 [Helianthus anomalus]
MSSSVWSLLHISLCKKALRWFSDPRIPTFKNKLKNDKGKLVHDPPSALLDSLEQTHLSSHYKNESWFSRRT